MALVLREEDLINGPVAVKKAMAEIQELAAKACSIVKKVSDDNKDGAQVLENCVEFQKTFNDTYYEAGQNYLAVCQDYEEIRDFLSKKSVIEEVKAESADTSVTRPDVSALTM